MEDLSHFTHALTFSTGHLLKDNKYQNEIVDHKKGTEGVHYSSKRPGTRRD